MRLVIPFIVIGLVSQALLWLSAERPLAEPVAIGVLATDGVLLTLLFAATDGSATPYALLYVFPVVLAGLTVRLSGALLVFAVTTAGYAALFVFAPADLHQHDHSAMQSHMSGMFVAYAATTALVVFAVARTRSALARAEILFLQARDLQARTTRLSSLATLAAGAAHELATPLSTITVVIRELERRTENPRDHEDIALVREELQRCHAVLRGLSADVGMGMGASPSTISVHDLVTDAIENDEATVSASAGTVHLPVDLVQQMLRRLVENARDADATEVTIHADVHDRILQLRVVDNGSGMSAECVQQVTEPFFTTKDHNTGLGLYFVDSVTRQLSGTLNITSVPSEGTTVTLTLPSAENP
jgi:two-component system sensor histidine kinase RegB